MAVKRQLHTARDCRCEPRQKSDVGRQL